MELFARDGYRGTGLAAIAARVGISQPTLRHHFGTKLQLLLAVVERRREQDLAAAAPLTAIGGAAIFDLLEGLPDYMRRRQRLVQLHVVLGAENLLPEHPIQDWFTSRYQDTKRELADALRTGLERGEFRESMDADVVAAMLIALIQGVEVQWLLDPDSVDLDVVFTSAADSLRRRYLLDARRV